MSTPFRPYTAGGGFPAIWYTFRKAAETGGIGGVWRMWQALSSKNACKTCALGMGGQQGGMVNESGHFPEVCKKSVQAMAADMQGRIHPRFWEEFGFDALERFTPRQLEAAGRVASPLHAAAGDRSYRPISWDEAMERSAHALRASPPDDSFFYLSGRSSNEAGFLLQVLARLMGTNNVNNCSFFCHQASGVALASVTGSGTATVSLDDVADCDLFFLIGGNPASNHPRLMRSLLELKRAGGKVVVINPMREVGLVRFKVPSDPISLMFGTTIADEYLMPHIGGDIALLHGLLKATVSRGLADLDYVQTRTEGYEAAKVAACGLEWDVIEAHSGVDRATIDRIAALYGTSKRTIFAWTMGITHHEHGADNVRAIANLAMARGMLGRPGRGLLPLRGHSNIQGIGSMGAVPRLKESTAKAIAAELGASLPDGKGMDTLECIQRASEGRVRAAVHLGGNLFGSAPDAGFAKRALSRIDTTIFLTTTLNTGHMHGRGRESIILPVLARDEEPQATTQESMFNFVRLSDGGRARFAGARSESSIIVDLGRRVLPTRVAERFGAFDDLREVRRVIAKTIPGYEAVGAIDESRREFHVGGRLFRTPRFNTPSGRARFHAVSLPEPTELGDGVVRLMTIRSEGQFNTVVYDEEDVYRGQERRDVILMSPEDIERLSLRVDGRVTVSSEAGEMRGVLVRAADIRPGNAAMYYPEANVLVPRRVDQESRTPSFKNVPVRVVLERSLPIMLSRGPGVVHAQS
jgi:molybdopterin-dependent oxidoreductase alpha subunit